MWDSFTYKKLDATKKNYETASGTSKIEHCVVEGPGSPLPIGSKVKILEEARCLYSMHIPEDDSFKKYFVSMIKIEVIDTGRTGWTWITSVKND